MDFTLPENPGGVNSRAWLFTPGRLPYNPPMAQKASNWSNEPLGRDLAVVAGLALVSRVAYLVAARRTPLFDYLHLDPLYYVQWGRRIAAGDLLGSEVFEQSPLYPYLLGAFFTVVGERLLLLRLVQLGAGILACAAIYLLAREAFGRREGRIAGALAAVYGPFLYYEGQVMKSFLTYTLMAWALVFLLRSRGRSLPWLTLSGLTVGLQALVRANSILLLPVLAAWAAWRSRGAGDRRWPAGAAALLLGGAAAILPATVRNAAVSGDLVLITSGAGEVFYIGNYPDANGAYLPPPFVRPSPAYEHQDFRDEASRRTGRPLSRAAASRYWLGEGMRAIAADPLRWIRLELRKLALFWNARELPDNYSYAVFAREVPLLRAAPTFGIVAPIGLVGMALSWRRYRDLLPLHLVTGVYLGSVLLFFNFSRFRLPVLPVLLVFAAHAIVSTWDAWRGGGRRRAAGIAGAVALLALPMHVSLSAADDAPGQEEILLGYARLDAGDAAAAEEAFAAARGRIEAFRAARGSAPGLELGSACFGLGSALLALGRAEEAVEPLLCAAEISPEDAPTLEGYARALVEAGRDPEAEEVLTRLLPLRPGRFAIYFDLASIAVRRGDAAGALRTFERGREECPEMGPRDLADYHLGVAIVQMGLLGDPRSALPHLREVVRLSPEHAQADEIREQIARIEAPP